MAARYESTEDDLHCPQCKYIYSLPVLLQCGHNICRTCLMDFWEREGSKLCPVCGTLSLIERPPINLALKLTADEYRAEEAEADSRQDVCSTHNEKVKIFCQKDEEPICLICKLSRKHQGHECSPVEEAAQQKKAEVSSRLDSMRKNLRTLQKTKSSWGELKTYIETQAHENEVAISEVFRQLHQFLREKQQFRLSELKREKETKIQEMSEKLETIEQEIQSLSSKISYAEKHLKAQDLIFLQEYKKTKARMKCDIKHPECLRDVLMNSPQNQGLLGFHIWKNMIKAIKYTPVMLDPNTAQYNLSISSDLSSMTCGGKQLLPDNPERCTNRVCALGAVGFTSGKHSWTVEVSQSDDWAIGVALDSIRRKETVFLKPAEGFWVIGQRKADSLCVEDFPRVKLSLKSKPEKITVELDYEKGRVVFSNAVSSTLIHTFKGRFNEKVFPFFSLGLSEDVTNLNALTICPLEITVVTAGSKDPIKNKGKQVKEYLI